MASFSAVPHKMVGLGRLSDYRGFAAFVSLAANNLLLVAWNTTLLCSVSSAVLVTAVRGTGLRDEVNSVHVHLHQVRKIIP